VTEFRKRTEREHKNGDIFQIHQVAPRLYITFQLVQDPQNGGFWNVLCYDLKGAKFQADKRAGETHDCAVLGCAAWRDVAVINREDHPRPS
jgi:hypothetical protein